MSVSTGHLARRLLTFLGAASLVVGTVAVGAVVTAGSASATDAQGLTTIATSPLPTAFTDADSPANSIATNTDIAPAQKAISCASATLCVAIGGNAGGYASVTEGSGSSWSAVSLPVSGVEPISVSCAPGTSPVLCVIVGMAVNPNQAFQPSPVIFHSTNGTTWTADTVPESDIQNLEDVACPSATRCVAVGTDVSEGVSHFISTDGVASGALTWNVDTASGLGDNPGFPDSLSCASATLCVAASNDSDGPELLKMGPGTGPLVWQIGTVPVLANPTQASIESVSCATASASSLCVTVGYNGNNGGPVAFVWSTTNGTTWTDNTPTDLEAPSSKGSQTQTASCGESGATILCAVLGISVSNYAPIIDTSVNGSTWNEHSPPAGLTGNAFLAGITCASGTTCVAWGQNPQVSGSQQALLLHGSNSTWSRDTAPTGLAIPDQIVCFSGSTCNGVGFGPATSTNEQAATTFGGTITSGTPTWTTAATAWPDPNDALAPAQFSACASSSSCLDVGTNGDLAAFNPTTGSESAATLPTAAANASFVGVSCAGTLCVAAGDEQDGPGDPTATTGVNVGQGEIQAGVIVSSTNESTWSVPASVTLPTNYSLVSTTDVSCGTDSTHATLCAVVGQALNGADGFTYGVVLTSTNNGANWTGQVSSSPLQNLLLPGVDCTDSTFCAATGSDYNNVYAATVTNVPNSLVFTELDSSNNLSGESVGCVPLTTTCVIVGGDEGFDTGNGTTWSPATVPGDFDSFNGITCTTGPLCVAYGNGDNGPSLISSTDGSTFTDDSTPTADGSSFADVACSSNTYCVTTEETTGLIGPQTPAVLESTDGAGADWSDVDTSNTPAALYSIDSMVCPPGESSPTCDFSGNSDADAYWMAAGSDAPPTAPDAPTLAPATGGNNQVVLNWSAPANTGGDPILGYDVLRGTTSNAESNSPIASGVTGTTYTDSSAGNGTTYYYEVEAVNAVGPSVASNEVSATPAPTVPGAPALTTATPGNGQVVLDWTAPSNTGGDTITGYDVLRGTVSGGEPTTPIATGLSGLTYTDGSAVNGTPYFYEVEAVNAVGRSLASNELSATPVTVPGAPTLSPAVAGNGNVGLTWTAPGSNGGATITGYDILRGTVSGGETSIATGVSGTTYTDSTAVNGTPYWYEVEAVNSVGPSIPSNERAATPSAVVPGAPALTSANAGNSQVVLNWTAPGSNGGSPITGYDILRGTSSGGETSLATAVSGLTYTDNTAVNGTPYFYEVEAVNTIGPSVPSNERSATPAAVPGSPTLNPATAGNGNVALSWTAGSTGGSPITSYDVLRGTSSGGETILATGVSGTTYNDSAVVDGTPYFYEVEAVNAVGPSLASNERTATPFAVVPGAPTLTSATGGSGGAALTWTVPGTTGGSPITGYDILRGTSSGGEANTPIATGVSGTTYTDSTVVNGTAYYYEVEAVNTVGRSVASNEDSANTAPGAPTIVGTPTVNADGSIGLNWSAPTGDTAAVTGYTVTPGPSCASCGGLTVSNSSLSTTITGLTGGTAYTFTMTAANSVGAGTPSGASSSVTPTAPAPAAPPSGATSSGNCTSATSSTSCPVTNGPTTATATGEGSLTVSQYSADPAGTPPNAAGPSFDVEVAAGSSFSSLTVTDCNLDGGATLQWWNGTSWAEVTPETLSAGPPACVTADLSTTSSPTISQLTGTVFAVANAAPVTVTPTSGNGYWEVASDGGIFSFGDAGFFGSMGGKTLVKPIVAIATTPGGGGYWEVASDGGVFAFGNAVYYGSMGGKPLDKPIVGIAATANGGGYWLVASDGGVFAFGNAAFHGSMGGKPLDKPIVGITTTPSGGGYWEVASDGGIFAFGDAGFDGSMGGKPLAQPIVGIATTPNGGGYWEVASDGGIFSFGNATYYGSMGGKPLTKPIVGIATSTDGGGYSEVASDGGIFTFGDAVFHGSMGGKVLDKPIVGISTT